MRVSNHSVLCSSRKLLWHDCNHGDSILMHFIWPNRQLDLNFCPLSSIEFSMSNTIAMKSLGIEHAGRDAACHCLSTAEIVC